MAIFTKDEAQRFAALMAGFDTGNPSEPEAISKGCVLRRMAAEKHLRLVDAWELPEIRRAIDAQLEPARAIVGMETETVIQCDCEPWPIQMMWFFVRIIKWCAEAMALVALLVGAFIAGCICGLWEAFGSNGTWKSG
jgi:hypothetical protein